MKQLFFVKYRRVWFIFSGFLVLASFISLIFFGLRPSIDFTGGTLLEIQFEETQPDIASLRSSLELMDYTNASVQTTSSGGVIIRLSPLTQEQHQALLQALQENYGKVNELKYDSIGPVIGSELRYRSLLAMGLLLILIAIYIFWAFRKVSKPVPSWKYGILAILSAFHDIIIPVGIFSFFGYWFGWEIGTAFIAALLTILGYSINDTIVVFDRTRENLLQKTSESFDFVVEKSIRQTLLRSFYTTITTLLSLIAIFIFGGDTTRLFALALIIGITCGAYSSFLASTLLVTWQKWQHKQI